VGQLDKAIKSYQSALRIRPNFVSAYINLGAAYDKCGDFVKALKVYAKAIVLAPQDAELRNYLGLAYFNIGSYAEAIKAFRQALVIEPDNARAHYCLGLVYLDLNDPEMALAQHSELKDRNEKDLAFQLLDQIQRQSLRVPAHQVARSNAPAR
jgi:tetratricopeptide (TPR) repeat protein